MDAALRRLVACGLSVGDAAAALATTPARALGLAPDVGSIAPGARADLVVCGMDASGQPRVGAVMRAGVWVSGPPA
jgi:N-acetylglucosamine-6-phosphate deacetylase